jgi:hypothetical protein
MVKSRDNSTAAKGKKKATTTKSGAVTKAKGNKGKGKEKSGKAKADRYGEHGENRLTPDEIKHLATLFGIRQVCGPLTKEDPQQRVRTKEERQAPNVIRLMRNRVVKELQSLVRYFPHYLRHMGTSTIHARDVNNILQAVFHTSVAGAQDSDAPFKKKRVEKVSA